MPWNYSANPATNDRDWVRFTIGDTNVEDPQLLDEEIAAMLALSATRELAAINCVRAVLARYARLTDRTRADASESLSQRIEGYKALLESLKAQFPVAAASESLIAAPPILTGTSKASKQPVEQDPDHVPHWAKFRIHDIGDGGESGG
jgi:hypothetical protein